MWSDLVLYVAVGFAAQLVDGAIGMAYGLSGTTVMLRFGIPPATASASVHAAEVFTTGISGFSHWRFGNVDWSFVWRLALPGMVGGAIGAYLLTTIPGETVTPFMNGYLLVHGRLDLWKAFRPPSECFRPAPLDRASGLRRRISRCDRRRRLGPHGDLDAAWPRRQSTVHDRLGQLHRVLCHRNHLGHLPRQHRPRALADHRRARFWAALWPRPSRLTPRTKSPTSH